MEEAVIALHRGRRRDERPGGADEPRPLGFRDDRRIHRRRGRATVENSNKEAFSRAFEGYFQLGNGPARPVAPVALERYQGNRYNNRMQRRSIPAVLDEIGATARNRR